MRSPDRAALAEHLRRTGIAGAVATPRENNLLHYRLMADRDPYYLLGLDPSRDWTAESVLELMARRAGVDPDPRRRAGADTIDPQRTLDALDRYADRLAAAALRRETVLLASGHPANLAPLYQSFADALRAYGCPILRAGEGWGYDAAGRYGVRRLTIAYPPLTAIPGPQTPDGESSGGERKGAAGEAPDGEAPDGEAPDGEAPDGEPSGDVAVLVEAGGAVHSHAARPIRATFAALATAGHPLPGLVIADHGWCGGAAQAGADAVGFADSNDPALFVGEDEGVVRVAVPLDDGLAPASYAPLGAYVLARLDAAVVAGP